MLSDADFTYIAREMRARCGALITRDMTAFIEARLAPLARREGFSAVSEFVTTARTRQADATWTAIADALIQHESRFFRDRMVFHTLRTSVLPDLHAKRGAGVRLKIWTAGCGSGQESYSLAMMIDAMRAEGASGADILATDLSERLLEKARTGLFTQFEVQRGLPIRDLIKHFEKSGELWRISDRMRTTVRFQAHNLMQSADALGTFDLILCRNVLSVMDPDLRTSVVERLAAVAAPGAVLVLGLNEKLPHGCDAFIMGQQGLAVRNPEWRKAA
jgi:chemotaxis protein methyltransferase CheR